MLQTVLCTHAVALLYCCISSSLLNTSKEPVCPRVELILKIIIILLIIFLGFILIVSLVNRKQ